MLPLLPLLALALLSSPAHAGGSQPWMWGVGPTLGTIVYPGRFPASIPAAYQPEFDGKVRGDAIVGLHGVMYIDGDNRLGSHLDLGFAKGYSSQAITFEYERIFVRGSGVQLFGGGGLGFGSYTLTDDALGKLHTPTYEIRAQLGALYKQSSTAEELSIFLKVPLNGNPTFTPTGGTKVDAEGGGNWFHVGLQATVYFGDFYVKDNKKKGKGKGQKKKTTTELKR